MTAIVGPNGSGRSTLLRTIGRLRAPEQGTALLNGADISPAPAAPSPAHSPSCPSHRPHRRACESWTSPRAGETPHRRWYDQWSRADEAVVLRCLERVAMSDLAQAFVDELSGGQRQRAWIAMALAQEAATILLDEPTTFLDIAHQLDVLELVASLNAENGATIVMVLHDLSMAARYADRIVALRNGHIVADGTPVTAITEEVLQDIFNLEAHIFRDQTTQRPHLIPIRRARSLATQCLTQERSPG